MSTESTLRERIELGGGAVESFRGSLLPGENSFLELEVGPPWQGLPCFRASWWCVGSVENLLPQQVSPELCQEWLRTLLSWQQRSMGTGLPSGCLALWGMGSCAGAVCRWSRGAALQSAYTGVARGTGLVWTYVHIVSSSHALIAHDWDPEKLDGAWSLLIAFVVIALLHVEKAILKTTFMSGITCSWAVVILTSLCV